MMCVFEGSGSGTESARLMREAAQADGRCSCSCGEVGAGRRQQKRSCGSGHEGGRGFALMYVHNETTGRWLLRAG